jgi:hypothetical protein
MLAEATWAAQGGRSAAWLTYCVSLAIGYLYFTSPVRSKR